MSDRLTLASEADVRDATTFVSRATAAGCEHIRLTARGRALALTVCVVDRESILDSSPTVLGVRAVELVGEQNLDRVIQARQLQDRLARGLTDIEIPAGNPGIAWAGIAPPEAGWIRVAVLMAAELRRVTKEGMAAVAEVSGKGAAIVERARRHVWSRPVTVTVDGGETVTFPAGMAFAADVLGFLGGDAATVGLSVQPGWLMFVSDHGYVLARQSG